MKANEVSRKDLMIGDWVSYHGIVNRVAPADFDFHHRKWIEEIEPIPLTAEILEKNLCTEPQIAWCVGWNKKDDIHVEIKRDDLNAAFYGVIDFVHQLQHALRLCGIDKEIIL